MFETLTITEDHVNAVVNFLRDEYTKAGLNILAKEQEFEVLLRIICKNFKYGGIA